MTQITKEWLIEVEDSIKHLWENGELPRAPIHFSGGNEEQLIEIAKELKPGDYIFSTHRSHYHYLIAGGDPRELEKKIRKGQSMSIFEKKINFLSSSIVAGAPAIAAGVAWALKRKESKNRVWCFLGDGAEEEGHFYEAVRYVDGWDLPCTFIIEDNGFSVDTPKKERYGKSEIKWPSCVRKYCYERKYPHVGTGAWVKFKNQKIGGDGSF